MFLGYNLMHSVGFMTGTVFTWEIQISTSSERHMYPLPSFSIHAGTGMTLTHWYNAQPIRFIGLLVCLYTSFFCTRDHAYLDRLQT